MEDRNESALILHATFHEDGQDTRVMLIGDSTHEILADVVKITKFHKREERLKWDIYDIPHHCSYLALSDKKGEEKTEPAEKVKWLLDQGENRGILVSCSDPIPDDDENALPPHKQAANYYKEVAENIDGDFKVTMEHPNISKPEPLIIQIDKNGAMLKKTLVGGSTVITSRRAPRAGIIYVQ